MRHRGPAPNPPDALGLELLRDRAELVRHGVVDDDELRLGEVQAVHCRVDVQPVVKEDGDGADEVACDEGEDPSVWRERLAPRQFPLPIVALLAVRSR